jgi:hypothetical protein
LLLLLFTWHLTNNNTNSATAMDVNSPDFLHHLQAINPHSGPDETSLLLDFVKVLLDSAAEPDYIQRELQQGMLQLLYLR